MSLTQAIAPHLPAALAGSPHHQNKLLEAARPFVLDHLQARFGHHHYFLEDLTQETLTRLYCTMKAGKLRQRGASTYIFTIAINLYIDHYRSKYFYRGNVWGHVLYIENLKHQGAFDPPAPDPASDPTTEEKAAAIRHLANRLNPRWRKLFRLHYLEGLMYKQVAQRTRKPLGTVKAYLHHARVECKRLASQHPHFRNS